MFEPSHECRIKYFSLKPLVKRWKWYYFKVLSLFSCCVTVKWAYDDVSLNAAPVRFPETPLLFFHWAGLHVVRQPRSEQVPWPKTLTLQLCVCEKLSVCACESVDPPKEDGRLPGWHRGSSPASFTVGSVQPGARRGDLAHLSPALVRPSGSSGDGCPHRRRDSSRAARLYSSAGPGQARGPGLWVCHAPKDGHHRPELFSRLRGHQHGSLEFHFPTAPADHLRRGEWFFPPVPGQEWCIRGRGLPAKRGATTAATQRVSAVS